MCMIMNMIDCECGMDQVKGMCLMMCCGSGVCDSQTVMACGGVLQL